MNHFVDIIGLPRNGIQLHVLFIMAHGCMYFDLVMGDTINHKLPHKCMNHANCLSTRASMCWLPGNMKQDS